MECVTKGMQFTIRIGDEKMIFNKKTVVEETTHYTLTTDDIENLLKDALNLEGKIDFTWDIAQWVELRIKVKKSIDKKE